MERDLSSKAVFWIQIYPDFFADPDFINPDPDLFVLY